jgi:low affinity Fe/Cu permease
MSNYMQKNKKVDESKSNLKLARIYNKFSTNVTRAAGRPLTLICAFLIIIIWAITGPLFNYSDSWQLVINTGTTIITFLMVFVIQQSQNKETTAIQLKLNELISSNEKASNRLVDIEDLTEEELLVLKKFYITLADLAEKEDDIHTSHSLDEAKRINSTKQRTTPGKKVVAKKSKD